MNRITRREFVRLLLSGSAGALLAACARRPGVTPAPQPTVTPAPPASPAATATFPPFVPPTALPPDATYAVQSDNRAVRNVRYYQLFTPPTRNDWRLAVDGLVDRPLTLTFEDVLRLPLIEQSSRMVCVEGWSYRAQWAGFEMAVLVEQAQPQAEGRYVRFTCGDGYLEVLPLADLLRERVLLAYCQEGEFLAPEYGAPLRLIVPWKWGFKGAKCITAITLQAQDEKGYWPALIPYKPAGDIEAGNDFAQDRRGYFPRVPATEQTY